MARKPEQPAAYANDTGTELKEGLFNLYVVDTGLPNHKVRDPEQCARYVREKQMERENPLELGKSYPRMPVGQARAFLGITKQDLADMVIAKAGPDGMYATDDAQMAARMLASARTLNPYAKMAAGSLALPVELLAEVNSVEHVVEKAKRPAGRPRKEVA